MFALPDEIWNIIKSFTFEWKKYHKIKLQPILKKHIDNRFKEIYKNGLHGQFIIIQTQ